MNIKTTALAIALLGFGDLAMAEGWYLVNSLPLYNKDTGEYDFVEIDRKLSNINITDSYDTASECKQSLNEYRQHLDRPKASKTVINFVVSLRCISASDPRL